MTRHLTAILALHAFAGLSAQDPDDLAGMVREADAVVRGSVGATRSVSGGVLHRVDVAAVIWGTAPAGAAWVFTLDPDVPDAPQIPAGVESVLGFRWVDPRQPQWAARLRPLDSAPVPDRIGVLCAGGALQATRNEDVVEELPSWIGAVRDQADPQRFEAAAARLIGHPAASLRRSALDELAERQPPASPRLRAALLARLEQETAAAGDAPCAARIRNLLSFAGDPAARTHGPPGEAVPGPAAPERERSSIALTALRELKAQELNHVSSPREVGAGR